jgi:hypothetical protein
MTPNPRLLTKELVWQNPNQHASAQHVFHPIISEQNKSLPMHSRWEIYVLR